MAKRDLPMMPWFPRDFLSLTRGWSVTAKGVYRELLDAQWEMGPLPTNPEELREMIYATPEEWAIGWPKAQSRFRLIEGRLVDEKLEERRDTALTLAERRAQGAQVTNAKRGAGRNAERNGQRSLIDPDSDTLSDENERSPFAERGAQRTHPYHTKEEKDKRGGRIPKDFTISEAMRAWALEELPNLDIEGATKEFMDYWKGVPGSAGVKLDWEATWRNGMRKVNGWGQFQKTQTVKGAFHGAV